MTTAAEFLLLTAGRGAAPIVPVRPAPVRLITDAQIFRLETGEPWRYRGLSAFPLLDRHARGEDVGPWLDQFPGYNVVRVWPYVMWDANAWDVVDHAAILDAIRYVGTRGFYAELTLLTDDDPNRIPWARGLVDMLAEANLSNLLIEIGNEPLTNKSIDVEALRDTCERSGYLYSSGVYEDELLAFGTYGTAHTPRDHAWARKAHDLMEYYNGGGPHKPHPGLPFPWVADEPIRPDQITDDPALRLLDYRAYGAVCSLLGAGALFHMEAGKSLTAATALELECARELLTGLLAFPADAPRGAYYRITEPDADPEVSRCYTINNTYMARVRPPHPAPPAGFVALDPDGVIAMGV